MRNLIPHLIHDHYSEGVYSDRLEAVTLFLDISGFTHMTQTLMDHGSDGAEILSDIINRVFEPLIQTVYGHSGFIVGFAGDAFTAVFPGSGAKINRAAWTAAWTMRQFFEDHGNQQTVYGDFQLAVKQGLAFGSVELGIVGPDTHKTFFFRGSGIDDCAAAEHYASPGDVILHPTLRSAGWEQPDVLFELEDDYAKVINGPFGGRSDQLTISPDLISKREILDQFCSSVVLDLTQPGEFRDVLCVFISFDQIATADEFETFAERLVHVIDQYGGQFSRIDYGDKGSNILVFFGAPITHENDRKRALDFILTLEDMLRGIGDIRWRAGMTYGRCRAGFVGSSLRSEYTVLGSSVNLSARFMMGANWGEIYVSEPIARHPAFRFEHIEDIAYKGFSAPIPTFKLLGKKIHQAKAFDFDMVERGQELSQLLAAAAPLSQDQFAGVALILGDAGMGKSRLTYELQQELPAPIKWVSAQADQILRSPLNTFQDLLQLYFNFPTEATAEERKQYFRLVLTTLIDLVKTHPKSQSVIAEVQRTESILGAQFGLSWPDSLYEQLDARGRYENTLLAIKAFLQLDSLIQPLVIEIEDASWLDEASKELLTALTRNMDGYPILIVMNARYTDDGSPPEFPLDSGAAVVTLNLSSLSPEGVERLASELLAGSVQPELAAFLHQRTEGNPFFAQQLLYYFQDNDLLEKDREHGWRLKEDALALPSSINAVLIARIDRLAQEIRETVKVAAVLGREFEPRLLSKMLQKEENSVNSLIQEVADEQIWHQFKELSYLFSQSLLRDAAYEVQLKARLRELHELAAEAYLKLFESDLSPYYEDLAYHFNRAQNDAQELVYTILAGQQAAEQYANDNAIRYFQRSLELTAEGELEQHFSLQLQLEAVCDHVAQREMQQTCLETLEQLSLMLNNPQKQMVLLIRQANYAHATGDYPATTKAAEKVVALAQEGSNETFEAKGLLFGGKSAWQQGDYDSATKQLERATQLAQKTGNPKDEADGYLNLGAVYWYQGEHDIAQDQYRQALTIYNTLQDRQNEAGCLSSLGAIHGELGEPVKAIGFAEQALQICRQIGFRRGEAILTSNLGAEYYDLGAYSISEGYLKQAVNISRESGNPLLEGASLDTLGLVYHGLNQLNVAKQYFELALSAHRSTGDKRNMGYALTHLGYTLVDLGAYEQALAVYTEAKEIRKELDQERLILDTLAGLAQLYYRQGDLTKALDYIQIILDQAEENPIEGSEYPAQVFLICYDILLAQGGYETLAKQMLENGYKIVAMRAEQIQDETLCQSFLQNVAFNRRLKTAWSTS